MSTRYYNPKVGRFLNADDTAYAGITGTLTSFNMFAYCESNPVKLIDSSGQFGLAATVIVTGSIVGGLLGAFNAVATGGNVLEAAIEGALTGLIGSACGLMSITPVAAIALAALGGAVVDFATQVTSQFISTGTFAFSKIDGERIFKTAVQTGLGTAIPQLGNAKEVTADAIGTALICAEGSALISCADVVVTNTRNSTKKQTTTRSSRRYGVSILDRELLLT